MLRPVIRGAAITFNCFFQHCFYLIAHRSSLRVAKSSAHFVIHIVLVSRLIATMGHLLMERALNKIKDLSAGGQLKDPLVAPADSILGIVEGMDTESVSFAPRDYRGLVRIVSFGSSTILCAPAGADRWKEVSSPSANTRPSRTDCLPAKVAYTGTAVTRS